MLGGRSTSGTIRRGIDGPLDTKKAPARQFGSSRGQLQGSQMVTSWDVGQYVPRRNLLALTREDPLDVISGADR